MTPRPLALLAELTHRCPLHCPYCSNPAAPLRGDELTAREWAGVLEAAAALGCMHAGFSGGEPLLRRDLAEIIAAARAHRFYTNLLTSGLGFAERAAELRDAGLDAVQISFQADEPALADRIAGTRAHATKLEAARIAREAGFALGLNVVLHRANIDRLPEIVRFAEALGAQRLELANVQFYGWAFANRAALLPTREQVRRAAEAAAAEKTRLAGAMDVFYVLPDYFTGRPKPCLQGWGQRYLTVNPVGDVLPCPTAGAIPGIEFENVRRRALSEIWRESAAFQRFRGTEWLPEPCQSCPQRDIDFGGCRCQAALIAGDPAQPDPACELSPAHPLLRAAVDAAEASAPAEWTMRRNF